MKDDERWTIRRAFRLPSSRERMRAEVDEELEFHIRGRMEELMSQGVARDDADREARRRFGDFGRIEHEVEQYTRKAERRRTVRDRLDAFVRDVRYAGRSLLRQPVFSLVVIVTLTLGIGATAAIFHAIDRVVLRPLPYPDAERIVYLGTRWDKTTPIGALPAGRFQFWHDNSRVFDGLATYRWFEARVGENDDAKPIEGIRVTPSYLDIVGARPIVGRGFGARDYAPEASPVAILGHSLWMSGFGGDPRVLDRTIRLDGNVYSVVGVLPASFEIAELTTSPSVVLPLVLSPSQLADGGANYTTIGRLRSGMGEAQISRDMATVFERFRRAFPEHVEKDDLGVAVMKYTQIFGSELATQLWISLGATLFVFLLACANVSNIVFARALTRQREFAVRAALGAGRWRIVRQVVIEMMWLGIISAALATAASFLTVRGLVALAHAALLHESQLHLDGRVVVLTTLVALAASLVIGLVVATAATGADFTRRLAGSTRTTGFGGSTSHGATRSVLVGFQSAIAMALLAGAGLLISSFLHVLRVDGGFRRAGIYTATIAHPPRDYTTAQAVHRFEQHVLDELRATPGIIDAAATATLPLRRGWNLPTTVEGRSDLTEGATEWRAVSPFYFRTMDISLVAGRDISPSDIGTSTPIVLVSQAYAKRFFGNENPIGKRILVGCYKGCPGKQQVTSNEIVGVVADIRDQSLEQKAPRGTIWLPRNQLSGDLLSLPAFVVRANDPAIAATALRRAIAAADPRLATPDVAAMNDIVSASMSWRRFSTVLLLSFATLALVLTCVGIYGVASYSVSQRVREIGLRMALGAVPRSVVALVVRQVVTPAVCGLVVGLAGALWLSRVLTNQLFGVSPHDPISLGAVAAVLMVVAIVASYVPARRAARVDPATALQSE